MSAPIRYYITSPYSPDLIAVTLTDEIYWAHQPLAVQALRTAPEDLRFSMAVDLARQGYAIDNPIMVWGWLAEGTMAQRIIDGYTWVPRADQPNIPIGPGIANVWNIPSYDPNNPPAGSIRVSVKAEDYPSVAVVPAKPLQPSTKLVGQLLDAVNGKYAPGAGAMKNSLAANVVDGEEVSQDGKVFIAHVLHGLFGLEVWFTLKA